MTNRIVGQDSKSPVAELLIERKRLKIECVAMGMNAATNQGFTFCGRHEAAAYSALSMVFSNPELLDKQPVPMGISDKAADNDTVAPGKCGEIMIIF